jgi:ATP-dependent DNA ligase
VSRKLKFSSADLEFIEVEIVNPPSSSRWWNDSGRPAGGAAAKLPCKAALIDGELIVQDENGISDFEALRSAIHKTRHRLVFFAFDLLHHDGKDLRRTPLLERRAALRKLIEPDYRSPIQFSDHVDCDGVVFFKAAADLGLEGIVYKRASCLYRPGRSRNWLKTKNMVEGEFVLLGRRSGHRPVYARNSAPTRLG